VRCRARKQTILSVHARPSDSRIQELEEENRRLHARLGSPMGARRGQSHAESSNDKPLESKSPHLDSARSDVTKYDNRNPEWFRKRSPEESQSEERPNQKHRSQAQRGESNYYGLTSTLFDDSPNNPRNVESVAVDPQMPLEWVQRGLMAEATRQRELSWSPLR
jgi:type II secretory pathway component PulJ